MLLRFRFIGTGPADVKLTITVAHRQIAGAGGHPGGVRLSLLDAEKRGRAGNYPTGGGGGIGPRRPGTGGADAFWIIERDEDDEGWLIHRKRREERCDDGATIVGPVRGEVGGSRLAADAISRHIGALAAALAVYVLSLQRGRTNLAALLLAVLGVSVLAGLVELLDGRHVLPQGALGDGRPREAAANLRRRAVQQHDSPAAMHEFAVLRRHRDAAAGGYNQAAAPGQPALGAAPRSSAGPCPPWR